VSTLESPKVKWFDIATLVIAGVASSVFFLVPIWTPPRPLLPVTESRAISSALVTSAERPSVPNAGRTAKRSTRAPKSVAASVATRREAKAPQSKLARLLLGDGSEPVRPFPMPSARSER
jgi:hypothetical protein